MKKFEDEENDRHHVGGVTASKKILQAQKHGNLVLVPDTETCENLSSCCRSREAERWIMRQELCPAKGLSVSANNKETEYVRWCRRSRLARNDAKGGNTTQRVAPCPHIQPHLIYLGNELVIGPSHRHGPKERLEVVRELAAPSVFLARGVERDEDSGVQVYIDFPTEKPEREIIGTERQTAR